MKPDSDREARKDETAKARNREGFGTVPNVSEEEGEEEAAEAKRAMHELEEEKGDWSKSRG